MENIAISILIILVFLLLGFTMIILSSEKPGKNNLDHPNQGKEPYFGTYFGAMLVACGIAMPLIETMIWFDPPKWVARTLFFVIIAGIFAFTKWCTPPVFYYFKRKQIMDRFLS